MNDWENTLFRDSSKDSRLLKKDNNFVFFWIDFLVASETKIIPDKYFPINELIKFIKFDHIFGFE